MKIGKKSCGPVVIYTGLPTQFRLYIVGVGSIPMEENKNFFFNLLAVLIIHWKSAHHKQQLLFYFFFWKFFFFSNVRLDLKLIFPIC